jgi:hypothetical protein
MGAPGQPCFVRPCSLGAEFVSDRDSNNYLLYYAIGLFFRYEYNKPHVLVNLTIGLNLSFGKECIQINYYKRPVFNVQLFRFMRKLNYGRTVLEKNKKEKLFGVFVLRRP